MLYGELIRDHYRQPRNYGSLEHPDIKHEDVNPLWRSHPDRGNGGRPRTNCSDQVPWRRLHHQSGSQFDSDRDGEGVAN